MKASAFARFASLLLSLALGGVANHATAAAVPAFLHIFSQTDTPSRLTADGRGNFYGVEPHGGEYGSGAIFRLAANGTFTVLYSFDGVTSGYSPLPLTLGNDGNLYGLRSRAARFFRPLFLRATARSLN